MYELPEEVSVPATGFIIEIDLLEIETVTIGGLVVEVCGNPGQLNFRTKQTNRVRIPYTNN